MITLEMCERAMQILQEKTKKDCIIYRPHQAENLPLKTSKLGGLPYLPNAEAVPKNKDGKSLSLLAQINCQELPKNDSYPEKGILQFWIFNDDLYGCDYDNPSTQNNFRICYYENTDEGLSEEEVKAIYTPPIRDYENEIYSPIYGEFAIQFRFAELGMPFSYEYWFDKAFTQTFNELYPETQIEELNDLDDEIMEELWDKYEEEGFVLGGYPFFTQSDPRDEDSPYTELLLQIDSFFESEKEGWEICWGDMGVANFFISKENLAKRNFTDVLYNWDCG